MSNEEFQKIMLNSIKELNNNLKEFKDHVNKRFDAVDKRFNTIEKELSEVKKELSEVKKELSEVKAIALRTEDQVMKITEFKNVVQKTATDIQDNLQTIINL